MITLGPPVMLTDRSTKRVFQAPDDVLSMEFMPATKKERHVISQLVLPAKKVRKHEDACYHSNT